MNFSNEEISESHKKACQKIYNDSVDAVISLVNEPSVALFRIQEHIRKTAPQVADDRTKACSQGEKLQGMVYDLDNSIEALSSFSKVQSNLDNLSKMLDSCFVLQQNISNQRQRRKSEDEIEIGVDVVTLLDDDC